ncbi:alpha/beta-hydrolase [Heliocybe sulcata]|uniref:Alpha/beta-hydrolase n=1 Tax=Heliocybe sulcata TaxID=5364 RepID=A0A5C3MU26_9AGAM|nr:alpha/beta-hydrolase [Heliocybe sulcata]
MASSGFPCSSPAMFKALLFASLALTALAAPAKRQSISTLSTTQIGTYKPYTWYASAAYCSPSTTINWSCGSNCEANAGFEPVASGGDGTFIQYWYVGYDPSLKTVIVAHQGTDVSKIVPDLEDIDFTLEVLDATLFPGMSSSLEVHSGFAGTQAASALDVLTAVKTAMSKYDTSTVTVTGHSLGAAIALLDYVFLKAQLPSAAVSMIGYGLPRVGNQAFANYVDSIGGITHVNNQKDPVPIVPGMFLGFRHPSGEIHIQASGSWDACPGQDNDSDLCEVGDVPTIFESVESDHVGPYDGVTMGC